MSRYTETPFKLVDTSFTFIIFFTRTVLGYLRSYQMNMNTFSALDNLTHRTYLNVNVDAATCFSLPGLVTGAVQLAGQQN